MIAQLCLKGRGRKIKNKEFRDEKYILGLKI